MNILIVMLVVIPWLGWGGWAEETMKGMSVEEKVGQLFLVPACQLRGEDHREDLRRMIQGYQIGGVLFKQGTVEGQRVFTRELQAMARVPLLCTFDGEWGLGMRLTDGVSYPKAGVLGERGDLGAIRQMGREIGEQLRDLRVHLNFAPVADINSNPSNPVIGIRSFGADCRLVSACASQMMLGMQERGILACCKHFPGHGDTDTDSHKVLPYVTRGVEEALIPFQSLIDQGVAAVMTAHLQIDLLDPDVPVTFSHKIVTELLQEKMGFKGLVITDGLNMRAMRDRYPVQEIPLRALLAGHDLLLYGDHIAPNVDQILREDIPKGIARILQALDAGELSMEALDAHVLKILRTKESFKNGHL